MILGWKSCRGCGLGFGLGRGLGIWVVVGVLISHTQYAFADETPAATPTTQPATPANAKAQAIEHFQRGKVAFDLGHFEEALRQYETAYRLLPAPKMLFNIGQCHRNLNHYEQALFAFRRYRRELPGAPNVASVDKLLVELKEKLRLHHQAEKERDEEKNRQAQKAAQLATLKAASRRTPAAPVPIYKKWWFWTVIGGVALGGGAAGVYFATRPAELPASPFPAWDISR